MWWWNIDPFIFRSIRRKLGRSHSQCPECQWKWGNPLAKSFLFCWKLQTYIWEQDCQLLTHIFSGWCRELGWFWKRRSSPVVGLPSHLWSIEDSTKAVWIFLCAQIQSFPSLLLFISKCSKISKVNRITYEIRIIVPSLRPCILYVYAWLIADQLYQCKLQIICFN